MNYSSKIRALKRSGISEIIAKLIFLLIILGILAATIFIPPYYEMQAFNRHTKGVKATYLEALFSDLRIINHDGE